MFTPPVEGEEPRAGMGGGVEGEPPRIGGGARRGGGGAALLGVGEEREGRAGGSRLGSVGARGGEGGFAGGSLEGAGRLGGGGGGAGEGVGRLGGVGAAGVVSVPLRLGIDGGLPRLIDFAAVNLQHSGTTRKI